jgi:MYXO-CTERM domain-containing protein
MRLACSKFLVFVLAMFGLLAFPARSAWAVGSIAYSNTRIQESNGGWHLQMTIVYGGKPPMPHVPMRFKFTPVAYFESYLDDKHGDKPQKRTIPLVGQTPINESVDVGFSDPRGKIYDRAKFDFTITRSHNFAAGEYDVIVTRTDGAQVGNKVKLILEGENPVVDRRAISFVDSSKKRDDKPATAATAAPSGGESAPAESTPAAATESTPEPASSASPPSEEAPDPSAAAKVPPGGSKGCGCRTVSGATSTAGPILALGLAGVTFLRARRRGGSQSSRRIG